MPVVALNRNELFKRLGKTYSQEEFELLCFEFGIELDDVVIEGVTQAVNINDKYYEVDGKVYITAEGKKKKVNAKKMKIEEVEIVRCEGWERKLDDEKYEPIYKIDIAANRYDLLCMEGIVRALKVFLGQEKPPQYKLSEPKEMLTMNVKVETEKVRPFVVCAVLRDVSFTQEGYDSFIALQEKLHFNICRRRTLVAIGTHDLDAIKGDFTYEGKKPEDIEFVPLQSKAQKSEEHETANKAFRADKLMEYYETDSTVKHIKPYVAIIKDKPVYPVIYDSNKTVLSLPPIINGEHSKITLNTKNVFIECTAVDLTKAIITLNTMLCMFGEYCARPFEIEPVRVQYPDHRTAPFGFPETHMITPVLKQPEFDVSLEYINSRIGVTLDIDRVAELLEKMQLKAAVNETKDAVHVTVPPTRSDIIHACDVMEDVAIAYGFNNIVKTRPNVNTIGGVYPLNKFSDSLRKELAFQGYTESLTLALCSNADLYENMGRKDDGRAVSIANPKTKFFEHVRTTLIPGLLKTIQNNVKQISIPIQVFEVNDVVFKTAETDTGAVNRRYLSAMIANKTANLEIVHGLLDRLMLVMDIPHADYFLKLSEDPVLLNNKAADVYYKGEKIGLMGIVNPTISFEKYGIPFPVSTIELDIERIFEKN